MEEYVDLIKWFINWVIICYDGDRVGIEVVYKVGIFLVEWNCLDVFVL